MPPRPVLDAFPPLRSWQRRALVEYLRRRDEDFLAVATPGAGMTTFALRIADELLADGTVEAVTVVTPTEHLKTQWAAAAGAVGIQLDAAFRNADVHSAADFHGAVVTYAQVGMAPQVHRRRTLTRRTLVILDEIHHAGDSRSWGDGVKSSFEPAVLRLHGMVDAGGLVIASDQQSARAYAKLIGQLTGEKAVVVLSDDAGASGRIAAFAGSQQRWLVAVRMVSEGVDIPRLAVGVYATSASTPLFFAQAVGRFVRARRTGETASVFVPSVAHLLTLASDMEVERDHVLGVKTPDEGLDDDLLARAQRTEQASEELDKRIELLSATAELDQVIFDGASFGIPVGAGTPEEEEYLGLPGLLTADQVATLLAKRQAEQQRAAPKAPAA